MIHLLCKFFNYSGQFGRIESVLDIDNNQQFARVSSAASDSYCSGHGLLERVGCFLYGNRTAYWTNRFCFQLFSRRILIICSYSLPSVSNIHRGLYVCSFLPGFCGFGSRISLASFQTARNRSLSMRFLNNFRIVVWLSRRAYSPGQNTFLDFILFSAAVTSLVVKGIAFPPSRRYLVHLRA